jgi:hypothetical protein
MSVATHISIQEKIGSARGVPIPVEASIQTTERYLGCEQEIAVASMTDGVCDAFGSAFTC